MRPPVLARSSARRTRPAAPRPHDAPAPTGGFAAVLDLATREVLTVTYGFDPSSERTRGPVVIRLFGHRTGAGSKARPGDQFVQDERIDDVSPDSGPISVTTRVRGINPGDWVVSARVVAADGDQRAKRAGPDRSPDPRLYPVKWSWRRWSLEQAEARVLRTGLAPLSVAPGVIPGLYTVLAVAGMVAALAAQQAILARAGVPGAPALTASLVAIAAGLAGAKARHLADHWRERRIEGWSIQGFLPAAAIVGAISLVLAGVPVGAVLDASTPGIFLGIAVGRIGCFFAGCCGGRPTTAAWGVWSSDQRVGVRRIPTQLLESGLNLLIAGLTLALVMAMGARSGGILVAGLSLYTLGRQGILRLRAERPRSLRGSAVTAAAAAVVLALAVAYALVGP